MSLIQCPACEHQVSAQAPQCPQCGQPIQGITTVQATSQGIKAVQLAGAVIAIAGALMGAARQPGWAAALAVGLAVFVLGRVVAWWRHG